VNDVGSSVTGEGADLGTAAATAAEINDLGGKAVADSHSVSEPESAQAIIDTAVDTWGRVDILVNNAGFVGDAAFEDMTPQRFEPLIDVHLRGAFLVSRPAWKVMKPFTDKLDPALVAAVVALLAHRDCQVSGEMFSVGGGLVARFFIGRTKGYFNPSLTPEDVRSHLAEIGDEGDYTVPPGPADEMAELLKVMFA